MSGDCPGMLDDDYWSTFSADFADYELGGPIGELLQALYGLSS